MWATGQMNEMHYLHLNNRSHYFYPHLISCHVQNLGSLVFLPFFRLNCFPGSSQRLFILTQRTFQLSQWQPLDYFLGFNSKARDRCSPLWKAVVTVQNAFFLLQFREGEKSENGFAVQLKKER